MDGHEGIINDNCTPCGYCRQFMKEFVDKDFKIHMLSSNDKIATYTIDDLLPFSFDLYNKYM